MILIIMNVDPIAVLFRWMHVLAAVIAVGGAVYSRVAFLPALTQGMEEAQRKKIRDLASRRWSKVLYACIALLLVSGFYNFFTISLDKAERAPAYHALFGIKFLAALGVFFLGSALVGRSEALAPIRARSARWLTVTVVLAVVVILISGVLRSLG